MSHPEYGLGYMEHHFLEMSFGSYLYKDFDPLNYPRCRYVPATSIINSYSNNQMETLVMYGGVFVTAAMEDLWYYSPFMNQFKWVDGSSVFSNASDKLPVYSAVGNNLISPGSRRASIMFVTTQNLTKISSFMVLFGGTQGGNDDNIYGDVFKFQPETPCSPGYGLNSSIMQCIPCSSGKFWNSTGDFKCKSCAPGSYSDFTMSSSCTTCQPGKFTNMTESTACQPCVSGSFASGNGSTRCESCPSGTFSNPEFTACLDCQSGRYSKAWEGICVPCPANATTSSLRSWSIEDCICPEGFYGQPFIGSACDSCKKVKGLICPPNSSIPFIQAGYARDSNNVNAVVECIPPISCEESGFSMEVKCASGYTGAACASCVKGTHFRQGLICKTCPNPIIKWIGVVILLLLICYIVERALSKPRVILPADVTIALGGVQLLSLLPTISSNWPKVLSGLLNTISLANLDIDLLAPECSVEMNFWDKYLIKMLSPLIFLGVV
jgi:hypothetical protein